ncbi:polynucleotide adenylyltransferase PcnB [Pusillimonas sp. NJUB218]|uniref:polynucleotide adenylyltransferase PcnB n=1 Tax=Pusillimonas sp. NJUB218 TaxID=2023230 RepID=UPI000F4D0461|nr:polynucleotide adenylyltransferase PcnB [Pusillimonas sp. NJUB218]ROT45944.1 poly(A) polymerase [Pusillimonas sp. NJUB218]
MLTETIKNFVGRLFSSPARGPERLKPEKHGIDRRNVSRHAIKVCEVLNQAGYDAYIVGGAVRDLIVGLEPKDFDVATNATPNQIRALFRRARIIGKRFQLVHVVFGPEIIETSTFRAPASEDQETDEHGRILRDNQFGTNAEDAARRDFTLNALYYNPLTEEVIDYHHGVADLKKKVVRMIGDPETRYREDPVRMLRAVRFASKLNANIDPASLAPIKSMAHLIENVPASRLFDELIKLLTCGHAMDCLQQLRALGLHRHLLPFIDTLLNDADDRKFLELALERTDVRVRAGKTISPGFLFAALLWRMVDKRWKQGIFDGEPPMQALVTAADLVVEEQSGRMAIQKRFQGDMREIWFMQPRFERATPKAIWRMIEHPRFRAAVDFLQLRAASHEVDSVQAQWWMDLANADPEDRGELIEQYQVRNRNEGGAASRSRRRRRPRRNPAGAAAKVH